MGGCCEIEATLRGVALVVGRSGEMAGAGGGPTRGAWWRSVWLGLECVDGSLAGAGVAAEDEEARLEAAAASGIGAGRVGGFLCVCWASFSTAGVCLCRGAVWGKGMMCWGRSRWRLWLVCMFHCSLL